MRKNRQFLPNPSCRLWIAQRKPETKLMEKFLKNEKWSSKTLMTNSLKPINLSKPGFEHQKLFASRFSWRFFFNWLFDRCGIIWNSNFLLFFKHIRKCWLRYRWKSATFGSGESTRLLSAKGVTFYPLWPTKEKNWYWRNWI